VAALGVAVLPVACSSGEASRATPVKSRSISADPTDQPKQWVTDKTVSAVAPYADICLADLYVPGADGRTANFDVIGLSGSSVIGIIANRTGAVDGDHFGIAIVPASGTGTEIVQFNINVSIANELLTQRGLCP